MSDRYIKAILTVIAIELLWIGVKDIATPVAAQTQAQQGIQPTAVVAAQPLPVIIRAIDIAGPGRAGVNVDRNALPIYSAQTLKVDADRAIAIVGAAPLKVETDKPLLIEAVKPLPVQMAPYTPGRTPGE